MKKILTIAAIVALGTVSYAQGLVSIATANFFVTTNSSTSVTGKATGNGMFYYELLIASTSSVTAANANVSSAANLALWTDSGVSGTTGYGLNAGKITAVSSAAATGWTAPGLTYDNEMAYIIVGWSANLGTTWSSVAQLINSTGLTTGSYFGYTSVADNYAGGGASSLQAVNMWGNATGTPGFGQASALVLTQVVPEPCTMALLGLGGLSLLVIRRRK